MQMNLLVLLAALTTLPVLTQVVRVLVSLLMSLIAWSFAIAVVMILLLALATHGKIV
jgi:hypothetical protein